MAEIIGVGQLSLLDLNDAIISGAPPKNPTVGSLWIDESVEPAMLKKWNGEAWIDLGELDPDLSVIIEDINETLGNMANDNLINFQERQVIKDKLTEIIGYVIADTATTLPTVATLDGSGKGSFWSVRKSARNVGISTSHATYTNVATRYNNLKSYLESLTPIDAWDTRDANADITISVTKSTFRDRWLQYYLAVDALAELTAQKIKENNDAVKDEVDEIGRDLEDLTGRVTNVESKVTDEAIMNAVTRTEKWVEQINTLNRDIKTAGQNALTHLYFSGEGDYVDLGSAFNGNYEEFSFQFDFRYSGQGSTRATFGYMVHKNSSSSEGDAPFVVYASGNELKIQVNKTGNNNRHITLHGYNDDTFYNLAVTFSNGTVKAYIDGELKGQLTNITFENNTGKLSIGGDSYGDGTYQRYFNGIIKNLGVWDKALTQEEIIYGIDGSFDGSEDNLLHYWRIDEGFGEVVNDLTNTSNGDIYGAEWRGSANNAIEVLASRIDSVEQNITADGIFTEIIQTEDWENIMSQFAQADSLGDYATKDELGELSEDVDDRIDTAIQGIDFEPYATKLELEETSRNITAKFSATGGLNLIRNSIGFADLDFWDDTYNLFRNSTFDDGMTYWSLFNSTPTSLVNVVNGIMVINHNPSGSPITAVGQTISGRKEVDYIVKLYARGKGRISVRWGNQDRNYISLTDGFEWYTFKTNATGGNSDIIMEVIDDTVEIRKAIILEGSDINTISPSTVSNTELDRLGFGSGFYFPVGSQNGITQSLPVVPGQPYTLSWYANKYSSSSSNGRLLIQINDNGAITTLKEYSSNETTTGYEHDSATYTPSSNVAQIRVVSESNTEAIITGLMFNIGDIPLQWSLSTGEVYNTNIRMDINGIRVSQLNENRREIGYTQITPDEFAGYYDSDGNGTFEKVFYLNGEETVTKKFRALNEITMGAIKIIKVERGGHNGWAFVPITD